MEPLGDKIVAADGTPDQKILIMDELIIFRTLTRAWRKYQPLIVDPEAIQFYPANEEIPRCFSQQYDLIPAQRSVCENGFF